MNDNDVPLKRLVEWLKESFYKSSLIAANIVFKGVSFIVNNQSESVVNIEGYILFYSKSTLNNFNPRDM